MARRLSLLGACAVTMATLAGCTSGGPATAPSPTSTAGGPRAVSFSDNGKAVHLTVGERLRLALDSPYWTFRPSAAPRILRQDATGLATPAAGCSGRPIGPAACGTRTADFTAVGAGRTSVVATRRICGEAMRCTASSGRFVVYVLVG